jgi:CRP-like cAMP-binding protein
MRVRDLLRSMDIFAKLPATDLETIAHLLRERRLAAGEVLCRQGEPGDALFIVTGGRIRLSTTSQSGAETILAHFSDGQFFGEMALLTGAPRSATAVAETDCQLLVLDRQTFDDLMAGHAHVMREMLKVISRRTVQTNQQFLAQVDSDSTGAGAGRIVAIFSPRGGSGKTTLAVNLAVRHAVEQPDRTALLDLSLTFGGAAALLGLTPHASLAGVPSDDLTDFDRRTLDQYLVRHTSGLHLLVAGTRPEDGEVVTATHVRAALGALRRQFSTTFVDCGSNFEEPTLAALEGADRILVICTPELNTLRDVRDCQRIFGEIMHVDQARVGFVFNRNQPFAVLSQGQFESVLGQPMLIELPHGGVDAYTAASRGEPLVLHHPSGVLSKATERLLRLLVPLERAPTQKPAVHAIALPTGWQSTRRGRSGGLLNTLRGKLAS